MTIVDAEKSRLHWVAKDMDGKFGLKMILTRLILTPLSKRQCRNGSKNLINVREQNQDFLAESKEQLLKPNSIFQETGVLEVHRH